MDEISWILAGKAFINYQYNEMATIRKSMAMSGATRPVLQTRYVYSDKVRSPYHSKYKDGAQTWVMLQDKPTQLALETLATFNHQMNINIAEFVREIVVSFLDDFDPYGRNKSSYHCIV